MKISKHALARMKQRGLGFEKIQLIEKFGTLIDSRDGVMKFAILKKDILEIEKSYKRDLQIIRKLSGRTLVVSSDGITLITAY